MTASQRAKQKCATKQNKPAQTSEAANCCCMVAPWEITEQDRKYILKVTKVGKGKGLNNSEIDVSEKLEPSNKEKNAFELHIVAPLADSDGKVTYKKISSKHKFLKKECDLKMLVKSDTQEKSIAEGGSFEIDTNGNIKGAVSGNCEEEKQKPLATSTPTSQQPVWENSCIAGPQKQSSSAMPRYIDITSLSDRYGSAAQKDMTKAEKEAFAQKLKSYMNTLKDEDETAESDLVSLFKACTNPSSVAKEILLTPDGSNKCIDQPQVKLIVLSPLSINGEVTIGYTPQHTVHEYSKKSWDAIANAQLAIEGKVSVKQGTKSLEYSNGVNFGGNEDGDPTYRKVRRKHAKKLFSGIHYPINEFYKCFASNPHNPKKGGVSFSAGKTELRFKASNITLMENQDKYTTGWTGSYEIGVTLFKGMNVKVDVINAILSRGNDKIALFVEEVREKVKEGYHGKYFEIAGLVEAFLIVDGDIDGFLKWEKTAPNKPVTPSGTISGRVGVGIEGKIEVESRVFELRAKGGIQMKTASAGDDSKTSSIEAHMSANVGADGSMDYTGDVSFTGLEIFYGYYAEVDIEERTQTKTEISTDSNGFPQVDNTQVTTLSEGTKLESKGSLLLIKDFSFGELLFGKEGTKNETN